MLSRSCSVSVSFPSHRYELAVNQVFHTYLKYILMSYISRSFSVSTSNSDMLESESDKPQVSCSCR